MAITKTIEIDVNADAAIKEVNNLTNATKKLETQADKTGEANKEALGGLDKLTGGAATGLLNMVKSVKTLAGGFNILKVAIIGTGIGALVIGVVALQQAFTRSEEGQNKFAKIMNVIGAITGQLLDVLANLGEKIMWAFENPKQAIEDFAKLIKENIVNRFNGLLELLPALGKAISLVFSGKFSEAGTVAANAMGKVALGVEDVVGKVSEAVDQMKAFVEETVKEAEAAGRISDLLAKSDKLTRKLLVDRANADKQRADLLEKAVDREKFSLQERIGFLEEAGKLEEEITNKEIQLAKIKLTARQQENALGKSNKDALLEEAQLKADLINLETARLRKQKEVTSQISGLRTQESAEIKAANDAKTSEQKAADDKALTDEAARLLKLDELRKANQLKIQDEEAITYQAKVELEKTRALEELDRLGATEEQKAEIVKYYGSKIVEAKKQDSATIKQIEQAELQNKLAVASQGLKAIQTLAGEGTKLAKAAGVASVVIDAAKGIIGTWAGYASMGPWGIAGAVAQSAFIAATAIKSISSITAAGAGSKAVTAASAPPSNASQAATNQPSFNTVGQTGGNQIAAAIGEQPPVKAYITSSEVRTQAELDRQVSVNATI